MNLFIRFGYSCLLSIALVGSSYAIDVSNSTEISENSFPKISDLKISDGADKTLFEDYYNQAIMLDREIKAFITKNPDFTKLLTDVVAKSQQYTLYPGKDEKVAKKYLADYEKARDVFFKKYNEKKLLALFDQYITEIGLWTSSHHTDGADNIFAAIEYANVLMTALGDKLPLASQVKYYFYSASYAAEMENLLSANKMLAVAEDLAMQDKTNELLNFFSFNMVRGMNDYFLGNLNAAISLLENAPEHSDENHDWYLYNNINLFLMYYQQDKNTGIEFLHNFLKKDFSDKNKETWAFKILNALNSNNPGDLISLAPTFVKNDQELAENLCEAYYYIGMKYYLDGAKDVARLFFVLSREQKVYNFLEYDYSSHALAKYFNK